jgi:acetyltransferase
MGVINTLENSKLNATFVAEKPESGRTAFLSQSGALGAAVLNSLRETDIKFAHFISVGNKADIGENEIIRFWQSDENIDVITLYLESFRDGIGFIKPFMSGEITKPVIVLKSGRTDGGMRAASSHTGALSGTDNVAESILNQFGVIRVDDINEMFNTAKGFERFPMPKGNRIGIVTNAGGPAILTVDALERAGLKLAGLSDLSKEKLREIVRPEGSVNNPVDLLPGGDAETYKEVNRILLADDNVDAVISIFVEPVMVKPMNVIEGINEIVSDKPLLQCAMPLPEFWNEYRLKSVSQKPVFRRPEDPPKVLSNMLKYSRTCEKLNNYRKEYFNLLSIYREVKNIDEGKFLSGEETFKLCGKYEIPIVGQKFYQPDELTGYADSFPVVLKGINEQFTHKSEMNGVKLNIKNIEELLNAAEEISDSFSKKGAAVDSFLIQPFISAKRELLVGGYRDVSFGPVIMFGSGGKYVEVFNDTSLISAFASAADIDNMISTTKIGTILKGVRGESPSDIKKITEIIRNSCRMLLENEFISEFDLNPVIIDQSENIFAVDVRIKSADTI